MIVLFLTVGLLLIGFGLMAVGVSGIEQGSNRAGTITAAIGIATAALGAKFERFFNN
mgnify:FL=1